MHLPMLLRAIASTLVVGWFFHNSGVVKARVISVLDALDLADENPQVGQFQEHMRLVEQPGTGQAILKDAHARLNYGQPDLNRRQIHVPHEVHTPLGGRPPIKATPTHHNATTSVQTPKSASVGVAIVSMGAEKSVGGENTKHICETPAPTVDYIKRVSAGVAPPISLHPPHALRSEQADVAEEVATSIVTTTLTAHINIPLSSSPCKWGPDVNKCLTVAHFVHDNCPSVPIAGHQCKCAAFQQKLICLETAQCRNHPQYSWFQQQAATECGLQHDWPVLPQIHGQQLMFSRVRSISVPTTTTILTNGASALVETTVTVMPITETVMSDGAMFTGASSLQAEEGVQTNDSAVERVHLGTAIVAAIAGALGILIL